MINSVVADVEVLPNLFSIIFVDLTDYLTKFKDCVNDKGKPVPLTEKYSVSEIKSKLSNVKSKTFYITDFDDSQLLEMVSYISDMHSRYITETDIDGNIKQIPFRTDLYGYNILAYDDLMISAFLMYFNRFDTTKELIQFLYNISKKIISYQDDDRSKLYGDKQMETITKFKLPYTSVDLFTLFHLNSCGVNIDAETGERKKFGKGLKSVSINLKWYELLQFNLPPICDKDIDYYHKLPQYKGMSAENINKLVSSFDRYIIKDYLNDLLIYNKNDVFICCEIVRQNPDEIRLRYSLSKLYKLDVLSSARSNIANKLVTKWYSERSGLHPSKFVKLRTERTWLHFSKIIFPHIAFKTPELQKVLEEMKKVKITRTNKDAFTKKINFYGTTYVLATGGIHTEDNPGIFKSTKDYTYVHWDYNSYYPSIMVAYNICPKHLNQYVFTELVRYARDTRVLCKHTKDEEKQVIKGIPNKIAAEALKIVINAIYGKFGSDTFFLYDRFAQMQVTINGQLMTMTLVEELELNGIHCISANTDGIVIKLPNDKRDVFIDITNRWNEANKMKADGEEYKLLVRRDVNNYLDVQKDDTQEFKGDLDPNMYRKDLSKGYNAPIVAKAVARYFIDNIPIMETLTNATDILDFCKTQNVGKQFELVYDIVNKDTKEINTIVTQSQCRFYVSKQGVILQKRHRVTGALSRLAAGSVVTILNSLNDIPITERNIDYKYYYEECFKIINPIKLGISNKGKGKTACKKYFGMYNSLFDEDE
uniref:DNA polymerase n=1 Tax=Geladintestivirus 1 TaxID=3233133 RepID=A0AAU8MK58_9CAUD